MSEEKNQEKKKKPGFLEVLFKLITLGGLLLVILKYFKKQRKGMADKGDNK